MKVCALKTFVKACSRSYSSVLSSLTRIINKLLQSCFFCVFFCFVCLLVLGLIPLYFPRLQGSLSNTCKVVCLFVCFFVLGLIPLYFPRLRGSLTNSCKGHEYTGRVDPRYATSIQFEACYTSHDQLFIPILKRKKY